MGSLRKKTSANDPSGKLIRLQEQLYHKAFEDAQARWAISSPEIRDYAADYLSSLPAKARTVPLRQLTKHMTKDRYVLYGDFHTLKQTQKGLVRLISEWSSSHHDSNKIVLALEMFHAKDQKLVDAYNAEEITEETFLERINYDRTWGFPWKNYKLILDFAAQRGIQVIGINSCDTKKTTLGQRDMFMAKQLIACRERYPDHVIVCLVGEYHLADKHLPYALKCVARSKGGSADCLRVFTNIDRYYFSRPHSVIAPPTEILYLKPHHYCVINSPPWIKWQSYIIWEEMLTLGNRAGDVFFDDTLDEDTACFRDDPVDLEFHLLDIAKKLADFLKIGISSLALADFRAFHAMADTETFHHSFPMGISRRRIKVLHERLAGDGYLFILASHTVIVSDVTLNNLASAAGQMLQGLLADAGGRAETFHRKILRYAAGMIASKIFNPRRKGKDILHYRQWLHTCKGRRLTGIARRKRDVVRGVIRFHEWISLQLVRPTADLPAMPQAFARWDDLLMEEITQGLGEMLGYTLYIKMLRGYVDLPYVSRVYSHARDLSSARGFMEFYRTIMH